MPRRCYICGRSGNLHKHHVIPLSKGGTDSASNIVYLCAACHRCLHEIERQYKDNFYNSFKRYPRLSEERSISLQAFRFLVEFFRKYGRRPC